MGHSFALQRIKDVLWILALAGLVVGIGRFVFGLGASTNMLDALPWGWWKIFNMVAGAAVATSGFVVACVIYIFQLEKYMPVARLSVLVGFLGYGSSLAALVFDIGLPHRGWHPLFMWNPHSFLFEVFWCVSMYWSVTALELIPIVSERFPFKKFTHMMHEIMLPFVVLGITLSTMHHSSLGSLFLASPTRLHPLWHTVWIPPEFFISAMGAGLATIIVLYLLCSWLYGFQKNMTVLAGMARASGVILAIYLVIKVIDLTVHHKWNYIFGPDVTWESYLFVAEILLQAVVPVALLLFLRRNIAALAVGGTSAFLGILLHRLNTGIVGYFSNSEAVYIPNLSEFILSFGVLGGAGLVFFFLVEKFHVFREPDEEKIKFWTLAELRSLLMGKAAARVLVIAIIVIPITIFALQDQATGTFKPPVQPVSAAIMLDEERNEMEIDGNKNGDLVYFPHQKHKDELGGEEACMKCHHLVLPDEEDETTGCYACHSDMELTADIFDRSAHRQREDWAPDKPCIDCHRENFRGMETYWEKKKGFDSKAIGYKYAMHGTCITCHRLNEKDPADAFDMGNCLGCHMTKEERAALKKERGEE